MSSHEQSAAITQITSGLHQIDSVTQQNSANAEETSAAAIELSGEAENLLHAISKFRIENRNQNRQF
jgi:methyl-accepting chemotaxis protein